MKCAVCQQDAPTATGQCRPCRDRVLEAVAHENETHRREQVAAREAEQRAHAAQAAARNAARLARLHPTYGSPPPRRDFYDIQRERLARFHKDGEA